LFLATPINQDGEARLATVRAGGRDVNDNDVATLRHVPG